jgi:hypothetical protein
MLGGALVLPGFHAGVKTTKVCDPLYMKSYLVSIIRSLCLEAAPFA